VLDVAQALLADRGGRWRWSVLTTSMRDGRRRRLRARPARGSGSPIAAAALAFPAGPERAARWLAHDVAQKLTALGRLAEGGGTLDAERRQDRGDQLGPARCAPSSRCQIVVDSAVARAVFAATGLRLDSISSTSTAGRLESPEEIAKATVPNSARFLSVCSS
jgi:hypothetical protein